jgi:hypothetical protein
MMRGFLFLKKGNTFFKRSIIEVLIVTPKQINNNARKIIARSLHAQFL